MSRRKVGAVHEIDRASASDLVTLATDRGQVPMNLGAVLIIDKGSELDLRDVRLTVAQRLPCVPRLRRRLLRAPFGCGRSVWVDDVEFDLDRHLSAVALPRPTPPQQTVVSRPTTRRCCRLRAVSCARHWTTTGHSGQHCGSPDSPRVGRHSSW